MAKDAKGHGSNPRGMAAGQPTYRQAATAAKKFAKQPSISSRVDAAKGASKKDRHADVNRYEDARKAISGGGDARVKMAAESMKLSRQAQRAADAKAARKGKK